MMFELGGMCDMLQELFFSVPEITWRRQLTIS